MYKNKQENGIFLSSTVGRKSQDIVVTHPSTPYFCHHSLKLLSPTLPKLMNWILFNCHPHPCPPTLTTPQNLERAPNASMSLFAKPNDIHQSDLLSLPHDKFKKKIYKYTLNIVDVASRYKGSCQLSTKNSKEVAQAFQWIYENTPLNYLKTLIVDDGKEFYGDTTKLMEKHDVIIQRADPSQHSSQGIMKRFNRTLADRLFNYQYHKEFEDPSKSNREWVSRLQNVVNALNNEKTRLIGIQ